MFKYVGKIHYFYYTLHLFGSVHLMILKKYSILYPSEVSLMKESRVQCSGTLECFAWEHKFVRILLNQEFGVKSSLITNLGTWAFVTSLQAFLPYFLLFAFPFLLQLFAFFRTFFVFTFRVTDLHLFF